MHLPILFLNHPYAVDLELVLKNNTQAAIIAQATAEKTYLTDITHQPCTIEAMEMLSSQSKDIERENNMSKGRTHHLRAPPTLHQRLPPTIPTDSLDVVVQPARQTRQAQKPENQAKGEGYPTFEAGGRVL